jgi:hypothetical protein
LKKIRHCPAYIKKAVVKVHRSGSNNLKVEGVGFILKDNPGLGTPEGSEFDDQSGVRGVCFKI